MFVTQKHLDRRTLLRGFGTAVALPFLDAMTPALRAQKQPKNIRLVCMEMVHGAAGSSAIGIKKNLWSPAKVGSGFDLAPTSLRSLAPFQEYLTVVSNTDVPSAEAFEIREVGGDHIRSSAVFLTQSHPKRTEGSDVEAGVSLDQLYAQKMGQGTPVPSMQLCIEDVDQGGGCGFGYSCIYSDTISWASPTQPLPMIRNPRVVFDELFGVFGAGSTTAERQARRAEDRSILDWLMTSVKRLQKDLGPQDRGRLDDYLSNVREVERRIQKVEALKREGPLEILKAPAGIPATFSEHVRMMFDLQVLAFTSDITRVFSFKLGRDNSNRTYPESGLRGAFHPASHHGGKEDRIVEYAKMNAFHVSLIPYFLDKLKSTPDGAGNLLDNTLVLYGSPMGDSNEHNHKKVPFFLAGRAGGALKGGLHIKAPNETPLANAMLSVLRGIGMPELTEFGDSEGALDLNAG